MKRLKIPLCGILLASMRLTAQDRTQMENAIKPILVMLDRTDGKGNIIDYGAGIIVGVSSDRVYIVTADHVVVGEDGKSAETVQVSFSWLPGERRTGRVLATHDAALDLAVLVVDKAGELAIPKLPFGSFVAASSLKRGEPMFSMGYPNQKGWDTRARAGAVEAVTDRLTFDGDVFGGNSGGAALSGAWSIAGLVTQTKTQTGAAVPIETVAEWLRASNYPVQWEFKGSAAAAVARPTEVRTYVVRFLEMSVKEDGSGGSTDWTIMGTVNGKLLVPWSRKTLRDKATTPYRPESSEGVMEIDVKPGDKLTLHLSAQHAQGGPKRHEISQELQEGDRIPVLLTFPNRKDGDFVFFFSVKPK